MSSLLVINTENKARGKQTPSIGLQAEYEEVPILDPYIGSQLLTCLHLIKRRGSGRRVRAHYDLVAYEST